MLLAAVDALLIGKLKTVVGQFSCKNEDSYLASEDSPLEKMTILGRPGRHTPAWETASWEDFERVLFRIEGIGEGGRSSRGCIHAQVLSLVSEAELPLTALALMDPIANSVTDLQATNRAAGPLAAFGF